MMTSAASVEEDIVLGLEGQHDFCSVLSCGKNGIFCASTGSISKIKTKDRQFAFSTKMARECSRYRSSVISLVPTAL